VTEWSGCGAWAAAGIAYCVLIDSRDDNVRTLSHGQAHVHTISLTRLTVRYRSLPRLAIDIAISAYRYNPYKQLQIMTKCKHLYWWAMHRLWEEMRFQMILQVSVS